MWSTAAIPMPPVSADYDCSGERAGRVYVQYWTYYGDSATSRALYGAKGYHRDDWEGYQVRISPDGSVDARASSHNGYNGADAPGVDWASDASGKVPGATAVRDATESLGLRGERGWTPSEGTLYVSGGSHAGHATEGSLSRELAGLLATEMLALGARPVPGPLGPQEERHRQELLAHRLQDLAVRPGSADHPARQPQAGSDRGRRRPGGRFVRDQPSLAEAGLRRPRIRGHRLSCTSCRPQRSVIFPLDIRSNPSRMARCLRLAAQGGAVTGRLRTWCCCLPPAWPSRCSP